MKRNPFVERPPGYYRPWTYRWAHIKALHGDDDYTRDYKIVLDPCEFTFERPTYPPINLIDRFYDHADNDHPGLLTPLEKLIEEAKTEKALQMKRQRTALKGRETRKKNARALARERKRNQKRWEEDEERKRLSLRNCWRTESRDGTTGSSGSYVSYPLPGKPYIEGRMRQIVALVKIINEVKGLR